MNVAALAERAVFEWHAQQKPEELAALGQLIVRRAYSDVIEVGTYGGGTARYFAALGLSVVAVDRDLSHVEYQSLEVRYVEGESLAMTEWFADGCTDLIFIDGDHSLQGVTADWEAYWPKVRPGGALAFHDVREHEGNPASHVRPLWVELRDSGDHETEEFVSGTEPWAGIGVIFKAA